MTSGKVRLRRVDAEGRSVLTSSNGQAGGRAYRVRDTAEITVRNKFGKKEGLVVALTVELQPGVTKLCYSPGALMGAARMSWQAAQLAAVVAIAFFDTRQKARAQADRQRQQEQRKEQGLPARPPDYSPTLDGPGIDYRPLGEAARASVDRIKTELQTVRGRRVEGYYTTGRALIIKGRLRPNEITA